MKKKKAMPSPRRSAARSKGWIIAIFFAAVVLILAVASAQRGVKLPQPVATSDGKYIPAKAGELTFSKDIAPIVFEKCSGCHRPSQPGPFNLLEYSDFKKRIAQIRKVTADRIMPPWLAEPGYGNFAHSRRLTDKQLGIVQQWILEGAVEGNRADLPLLPKWNSDWQLGTPDLVLQMPKPYPVPADGMDIYRSFAIPVRLNSRKYVRGIEYRMGDTKAVHHATTYIDKLGAAAKEDGKDGLPGFFGMRIQDGMQNRQFMEWQPGRMPEEFPKGLAMPLEPGENLIFQLHLVPTGKPELVQSSIALYFTDQAPTNQPVKFWLNPLAIEIPAGETNHVVEDSFILPVDAQLLAISPHAHYLARQMHGWATLPDGRTEELLLIKQWDFYWQGSYRYEEPVSLPKGTKLSMRFTYDNSTNSPRNPNNPPIHVSYGPRTKDEMAELWFQVLPKNQADAERLEDEFQRKLQRNVYESELTAIRKNPNDTQARTGVGIYLYHSRKYEEARAQLRIALSIQSNLPSAHYYLGLIARRQNNVPEAIKEFEAVLSLDASDAKAHGNLGNIYLEGGDFEAAQRHFAAALQLQPDDAVARDGLSRALQGARSVQRR